MSDELLRHFVLEGRDLAQQARDALLALERDADTDQVDVALRAFHTLKGSAGLFDLAELSVLLHAAEDQMSLARTGERLAQTAVRGLLEAAAEVERWVDVLESDGAPTPGHRANAARLARRLEGGAASEAQPPAASGAPAWALDLSSRLAPGQSAFAVRYRPDNDAYFRGEDPVALLGGIPGLTWLGLSRPGESEGETYSPFVCDLELTALFDAEEGEVRRAFRLVSDQVDFAMVRAGEAAAAPALRTLRVEARRVDELASLLDETVIAKNALSQAIQAAGSALKAELSERQGALDRALGRLHDAVGQLRLASLSEVFGRLQLQGRGLADQLGKNVDLQIHGGDVQVDKDIVAALFEPLIHVLRNALDHGVETDTERRAAGKADRATIRISARAAGAKAIIELNDDGRGLDLDRIRAVAASRGLIAADAAQELDDAAAVDLIFTPGFSTARQVSEVSGRGVGLDAVRAAVARLGGTVDLDTRRGAGSTVRIAVPLRAVMTKVAIVTAAQRRLGIPIQSVREIVRLERRAISEVRHGRAFVHRDEVLPLFELGEVLGGAGGVADPVTVMVIGQDGEAFGLAVDAVVGRLETPVRPPAGILAGHRGLRGAVVEIDGKVLMVVDPEELVA